jgi:Tol biopolymer transport system component
MRQHIGVLIIAAAACSEPSSPAATVPMTLTAITPVGITGTVGETSAPAVRVQTAQGVAVANVGVSFVVVSGGGAVGIGTGRSDAEGIARPNYWKLGTKIGENALRAQLVGTPAQEVVFRVTAAAGPAAVVTDVSGNWQSALTGAPLALPLRVRITDEFGNALAGERIEFSLRGGSGSIDGAATMSDANGEAVSGRWTLGDAAGEQQAEATSGALKLQFSARALERCAAACPPARLAFVRDGDIFSVNSDGSDLVRLTLDHTSGDPAWSPDGKRIAFDRGMQVWVMNADGTAPRLLAMQSANPTWSPDGRRIAMTGRRDGSQNVIVMYPDDPTKPEISVGFPRGYNTAPAWSPDGYHIAFIADWAAFDFALEVFVGSSDGSETDQITDGFFGSLANWPDYTVYGQPAWSPEGKRIALLSCPAWQTNVCDVSDLAVMNADGSRLHTIARAGGYARPAWSPDGTLITFTHVCATSACTWGVFAINPDGTGERLLIANAQNAVWRP